MAKINEELSMDDDELTKLTKEEYQDYLDNRNVIRNDRLEEKSIFDASSCKDFAESEVGQLVINTLKDLNKT